LSDVDGGSLFTDAGAPPDIVDLTFIIDTSRTSSPSTNTPSVFAGNFVVGSKITIIFVNASIGQAKGGQGGNGASGVFNDEDLTWEVNPATNGFRGGVVYDAQGITTDIYLSGDTPSINFPVADGFISAPAGGAGGFSGNFPAGTDVGAFAGDGGDGGDGNRVGPGGNDGIIAGTVLPPDGEQGASGQIDGTGSGFGVNGANNGAVGGLAGKGIVTGGAQVNLYDILGGRLINGSGDTPGNPLAAATALTPTTEMGDFS